MDMFMNFVDSYGHEMVDCDDFDIMGDLNLGDVAPATSFDSGLFNYFLSWFIIRKIMFTSKADRVSYCKILNKFTGYLLSENIIDKEQSGRMKKGLKTARKELIRALELENALKSHVGDAMDFNGCSHWIVKKIDKKKGEVEFEDFMSFGDAGGEKIVELPQYVLEKMVIGDDIFIGFRSVGKGKSVITGIGNVYPDF